MSFGRELAHWERKGCTAEEIARVPGLNVCNLMKTHQLPKMTRLIAVVDDDAAVRKALTRLLETSSYIVRTFGGASDFVADLANDLPACALIDLQMPDITGLELQQYLVAAGTSIPTIIMTAHDEPGGRERCMAAGAAAYLLKPLRKASLIAAIEDAVEGAR